MDKKYITINYLKSLIKTKEDDLFQTEKYSNKYDEIRREIIKIQDLIYLIKTTEMRY